MTVAFFGHSDTPQKIQTKLEKAVVDLIEKSGADEFYVGNHGNFDRLVGKTLKRMQERYPHIRCAVVLAYMPEKAKSQECLDTVYPEGLESTPPKFAIIKRNRWMIKKSDCVVTYVKHNNGGAGKFQKLAEKKGKIVYNLAEDE